MAEISINHILYVRNQIQGLDNLLKPYILGKLELPRVSDSAAAAAAKSLQSCPTLCDP